MWIESESSYSSEERKKLNWNWNLLNNKLPICLGVYDILKWYWYVCICYFGAIAKYVMKMHI